MKNYGLLDRLTDDDFEIPLMLCSTPNALRRRLQQTTEVRQINAALRSGSLTEATLRRFVDDKLKGLTPGTRFPHDTAFAALAVALEDRYTLFADDYIKTLSQLRLMEMSLSISVAELCREQRHPMPVVLRMNFSDEENSSTGPGTVRERPRGIGAEASECGTQIIRRTGTC